MPSSIDWAASYSTSWRVALVDPVTWQDSGVLAGVTEASVKQDAGARLLVTGTLTAEDGGAWESAERWCRIEALVTQGGLAERHAIATLLVGASRTQRDRSHTTVSLEGRSSLAPAEDELLLAGTVCPMGVDGAGWAASMLSCCPAPITINGAFEVADHTVFAAGTSRLEAACKVLDDAGWRIRLDGDGSISLTPLPSGAGMEIDGPARLLATEVESRADLSEAPNRYVAADSTGSATATDEDPTVPTSHAARGRWVDVYDSRPSPRAGESLEAYAERMLRTLAHAGGRWTYERAWVPDTAAGDVVHESLPAAGIDCDVLLLTQDISLARDGISLREEVEEWPGA